MKGRKIYYEPVAYFTSRLMYSLNSYANKNKKFCEENEKNIAKKKNYLKNHLGFR